MFNCFKNETVLLFNWEKCQNCRDELHFLNGTSNSNGVKCSASNCLP